MVQKFTAFDEAVSCLSGPCVAPASPWSLVPLDGHHEQCRFTAGCVVAMPRGQQSVARLDQPRHRAHVVVAPNLSRDTDAKHIH